ncbi:porin [Candidatus Mesenet endosymbiont of Agriotes lineatus]|uniref:porin n=1 Tax=Candidatus Mesenet endosymbiont of Agriotes lineatus TaxID=3077948 RepID=UPI0030CFF2D8
MKKILSITTALTSLVAFYGINVLADPLVEVEQKNVNKEVEQRKISRSDEESDSEVSRVNKAKIKLEEKRVCGKGEKACGCKHNSSFKEGPHITIGGGFNTQFHKTSDVKDYDIIPGDDKFADANALFGEFSNGIAGDYSKTSGTSVDTTLNIRAENTNYDLGLAYGADIKLNVPITKSSGMRSRGAHIFANTEFGDMNVGFMEGAESIMRLDASRIAAGDGGADSNWFRKANLEGHKGNFPFYVTPRLYSESLFSESDWLSFRDAVKYNKSFIDTQPFRVSYFSPSFMGLKAGVSYSPNYDSDLFTTGGMQKIKYIDPAQNPGNNADVNAQVLNKSWYNTANAALKAARDLKGVSVLVQNAAAIVSRDAAIAAITIAERVYNEARTYNQNLPEIQAALIDPANIPNVADEMNGVVLTQAAHSIITNIVTARAQCLIANPAGVPNAVANVAARNTVINTGQAIARIAALASGGANAAVSAANALPQVGGNPHPAIADVAAENTLITRVAANGYLYDIAVGGGGAPNDDAELAAAPAPAAADAGDVPVASTTVRAHAENAAIAAFRAAATAQNALGVSLGTAKEFYTLLATSGNYVGPNYENIVSGGVSYEYDFDDFKVKVSATGEKGQVKDIKGDRYGMYGKYNDLMAFNLGLSAEYFGFKFAASYANLGKSGQPKEICIKNADSKYDCKDDKVKALQKDTYYWTAGAGYEFGNAYVSATYFKSKSAEANELSDIVIGAEYNLSSNGSKNPLVPYVTWHHFEAKEKELPSDKKNNKGNIFLVGVKHSF